MRITLEELRQAANVTIERVDILSLEGQRYMATLYMGGRGQVLSDGHGQTLLFRSSWEIKDSLAAFEPQRLVIIHPSAYNEMIGMDPAPVPPLSIDLQRRKS
ncbi:DUF6482 family protein [Marinobacter sp. CA1]|uniref:DUF6482 family protein n=1 Tax=Marinobacter sp. CA1 TaxID=2817656 RepID=UPI001D065D06|nr:DUF6482 family protein [Marinobacter sp. CA1]UDL04873.1 hypothetical protein J2887_19775 [Marinobacter sp. CA1]